MRFGEPLPLVHVVSNRNPKFALGALGGRFVLLCVVGVATDAEARTALAAAAQAPSNEDARLCAIFWADPKAEGELERLPQERLIFNDPAAARAAGLIDPDNPNGRWVLIDPSTRAIAFWPLGESAGAIAALAATPDPSLHAGVPLNAPVLIAPRVFEPAFCKTLIDFYRSRGGEASGVTKVNESGKTVVQIDDGFKRRSDVIIDDAALRTAVVQRLFWRLAPEIEKAFMWRPTRIERHLVARYDAEGGGFFRPHRDNTTAGTAHRRFAVTINLNAGEYEGGDLRFPEFGARTYRAPTGGAVVFSCALLHEAMPVTRGERFAFLPFLYDEEASKIRLANNQHLDESIRAYDG